MARRRMIPRLVKYLLILGGIYGGWVLAGTLDRDNVISPATRHTSVELLRPTIR